MIESCIPLSNRAAWEKALVGVPHAFAHTWGSCHAMSLSTGDHTYLYIAEADNIRIVCPIAEREFNGYTDIYTPYGFSGFVGNGWHQSFSNTWARFVARRGYVCGYFGLNPFLDTASYFTPSALNSSNTVYALDLRENREGLFRRLHVNRRRQLAHFDKASEEFIDDKESLGRFFLAAYGPFFHERSASSVYDFNEATLSNLFSLENVFLVGAGANGQVQAVSVFAYTSEIGEYLFNVSIPEGRKHSAALIWSGMTRLQLIGIPTFNLGGGVRDGDGVARFKERFGARQVSLHCAKQVYRPDAYERLCEAVGESSSDMHGYFPAFRRQHRRRPDDEQR